MARAEESSQRFKHRVFEKDEGRRTKDEGIGLRRLKKKEIRRMAKGLTSQRRFWAVTIIKSISSPESEFSMASDPVTQISLTQGRRPIKRAARRARRSLV